VAVQIVPERPDPMPGQVGAHKEASRRFVPSGERLGYAIRLHNGSRFPATLDVTDPLPAEVEYVAGSASHGAVYDGTTRTLTWSGINVPPMTDLVLSFAGQVAARRSTPRSMSVGCRYSGRGTDWPEGLRPAQTGIGAVRLAPGGSVGEQFAYTIRLHNGGRMRCRST
jgi:uncharacterized repeat protein (TIGR01451 family)